MTVSQQETLTSVKATPNNKTTVETTDQQVVSNAIGKLCQSIGTQWSNNQHICPMTQFNMQLSRHHLNKSKPSVI